VLVILAMMPKLYTVALVILGLGCPHGSHAGVLGRNRLHIVSQRLQERLRPSTQSALAATVRYDTGGGWGTAFIVQQKGNEVLAFTNNHVTSSKGVGAKLEFLSAKGARTSVVNQAVVEEVVSTSPELDYSLVRARLTVNRPVETLKISGRPLVSKEKIVAIGFANVQQWARSGSYDQTRFEKRLLDSGAYDRQKLVQVGSVLDGSSRLLADPDPRINHRSPQPVWSVALNTTAAGGASGSPIISASDHRVRAIHWTSSGVFHRSQLRLDDPGFIWTSAAYAVPMTRILDHLKQQLASGGVSEASRAAVRNLVTSAQ
jgi:hypothetical protein